MKDSERSEASTKPSAFRVESGKKLTTSEFTFNQMMKSVSKGLDQDLQNLVYKKTVRMTNTQPKGIFHSSLRGSDTKIMGSEKASIKMAIRKNKYSFMRQELESRRLTPRKQSLLETDLEREKTKQRRQKALEKQLSKQEGNKTSLLTCLSW